MLPSPTFGFHGPVLTFVFRGRDFPNPGPDMDSFSKPFTLGFLPSPFPSSHYYRLVPTFDPAPVNFPSFSFLVLLCFFRLFSQELLLSPTSHYPHSSPCSKFFLPRARFDRSRPCDFPFFFLSCAPCFLRLFSQFLLLSRTSNLNRPLSAFIALFQLLTFFIRGRDFPNPGPDLDSFSTPLTL